MKLHQLTLAAALSCAIAILIGATLTRVKSAMQTMPAADSLPVEGELPSLAGAIEWLNSHSIDRGQLAPGKSSSSISGPIPALTGDRTRPVTFTHGPRNTRTRDWW